MASWCVCTIERLNGPPTCARCFRVAARTYARAARSYGIGLCEFMLKEIRLDAGSWFGAEFTGGPVPQAKRHLMKNAPPDE